MTQDYALNKMVEEMSEQNLFPKIHTNIIRMYLTMAYGIGYNKGNRVRTHEKAVMQFDEHGNFIEGFESLEVAARKIDGHATNISKVCRGLKHKYKGFIWKYETYTE